MIPSLNALPLALALVPVGAGMQSNVPGSDPCQQAALEAFQSCRNEAQSDFWLARGKCSNLPSSEVLECRKEAFEEYLEATDECWARLSARSELCDTLGGGIYAPVIDPDDFVDLIDNPWLPLAPGTTFVYEKVTEDETERIEVEVTDDTVEILGVTCTVVRDTASVDGEIQEDTYDWYAQDVAGNVWYFGELSFEYEDGEIAGIEGSWKAGVDGAQPGIVMLADPMVGDVYRQEFELREAEDVGGVLSLDATASVPVGTFTDCLQTEDYTPLEPDALEDKFYAPGLGLVLELDVESGERTELIEVTMG